MLYYLDPFMEKILEIVNYNTNFTTTTTSEKRFNYAFNVPNERIKVAQDITVRRKNEAKMNNDEKNAFINAIKTYNILAASPAIGRNYRQTVAIHRMNHKMHSMDGPVGKQRFLTWHRIYLAFMEGDIRTWVNPNFFIPYWDWIQNPSIPDWLKDFLP